jgi:chromosome segregation ATPase
VYLAATILMIIGGVARAQVQRTGSDSGMLRLQQQLQQLTAAKAEAQAQSDKLKQENESLKQQLQKLSGEQSALKARSASLTAAAQRDTDAGKDAAAASEKLRAQLQELIERFRATAQALKDVETDRGKVRSELAVRQQDLAACTERNAKLYELNGEVLDKVEQRGFWSAVAEREPFTKIARARLENLSDDYHSRAADLRLP